MLNKIDDVCQTEFLLVVHIAIFADNFLHAELLHTCHEVNQFLHTFFTQYLVREIGDIHIQSLANQLFQFVQYLVKRDAFAFGKVVRAGVNFYAKGRGVEQWIEGFSPAYDGNRAEKLADRYLMKALAEKPYSRLGVYEIMERSMARDGISAEERQSVFRDLVQQATKAASQKERDAVPEKEAPALVR